MNQNLFSSTRQSAYAALLSVVDKLGEPLATALNDQARLARVLNEVPGRMIDLVVPDECGPCDCRDGPLPGRTFVIGSNGTPTGELLIWVRAGRLAGMEQAWFTDDMPTEWPKSENLAFRSEPIG